MNFPTDWKKYFLSEITNEIIIGGTPSTKQPKYWNGKIAWLSSTEIHQKKVITPTKYITDLGLKNSAAKIAPKDSVLIALAGQGKTRGTAAYLMKPMALNQSLAALVTNEKCDSLFLYYLMDNSYFKLRKASSGDGGRGGLTKKIISNFIVHVPPLAEQKEIVKVLSAFDDYIDALSALLAKKKDIRNAALAELMSRNIRLQGFSGDWQKVKLGEFCKLVQGEKLSGKNLPYLEVKYLRSGKNEKTVNSGNFISAGTKIILVDGENSGEVFIAPEDGYMGSTFRALKILSKIDADFFYYFLLTKKELYRRNKSGSAIPHLNKDLFFSTPVPLPPLAEQKAIAEILGAMDEDIAAQTAEREKVIAMRAGAMEELLTGQTRLKME